jgi:hypothetical protein
MPRYLNGAFAAVLSVALSAPAGAALLASPPAMDSTVADVGKVTPVAKRDRNRPSTQPSRSGGARTNIGSNNGGSHDYHGGHNTYRGGNNTINIDVDNGWNNGPWDDEWHPVATAAAVTATVAVTRAVIGTRYYALPPNCVTHTYGGTYYYYCGETWYAPQYAGTQITYIVVQRPY